MQLNIFEIAPLLSASLLSPSVSSFLLSASEAVSPSISPLGHNRE